jgi:hypothetical protein
MGIRYRVDSDSGVVYETWTGDVTIADLETHWRTVLADPEALKYKRNVADMREGNVCFTGAELSAAVNRTVLPRVGQTKWKTAYVVSSAVHFGTVRQYCVFAQTYLRDAIFQNPDEALSWLLKS